MTPPLDVIACKAHRTQRNTYVYWFIAYKKQIRRSTQPAGEEIHRVRPTAVKGLLSLMEVGCTTLLARRSAHQPQRFGGFYGNFVT